MPEDVGTESAESAEPKRMGYGCSIRASYSQSNYGPHQEPTSSFHVITFGRSGADRQPGQNRLCKVEGFETPEFDFLSCYP